MTPKLPNMTACQTAVTAKLIESLAILKRKLNRDFPMPNIEWMGVKGRVGGRANTFTYTIKINWSIMVHNLDDYVRTVIPHELAHLVARRMYGMGIDSHGKEWGYIMNVLGLPAIRCHSYDTSVATTTHLYKCRCKKHKVSTTLHNRMQKGRAYTCKSCRGVLIKVNYLLDRSKPLR